MLSVICLSFDCPFILYPPSILQAKPYSTSREPSEITSRLLWVPGACFELEDRFHLSPCRLGAPLDPAGVYPQGRRGQQVALESGTRLSRMGPDFLEQRPQQPLLWVTVATRAKGELAGLWAGVNVREPLGSTRCPPASARARRTWKGGVGQAPVWDLPPGEHTLPLQCRPQWGRQTISPGERWLALLVPLSSPRLTRAISVPQE